MAYYGQQQQQAGYGYQPQYGGAAPYPPQQAQQPPPQQGWNVPQSGGGGGSAYGTNVHYAESGGGAGMPKNNLAFTDQTIRSNFVRKVFFLVAIMLSVVALMSAFPFMHPPTMQFVQRNIALYIVGYVVFLVVYLVLICCDSVRRSYPANIICLGILTLAIGYMTMTITAFHSIESVFLCFTITAASCLAVSLFAMVTKKDLTSLMGIMFIATVCLCLFGLIIMFISIFSWQNIRTLYVVYAAIGALLFMVWLAIDIQMIMGGRKYELSPEEYILAAMMLFLDIIQIFWFILMLFGDRN